MQYKTKLLKVVIFASVFFTAFATESLRNCTGDNLIAEDAQVREKCYKLIQCHDIEGHENFEFLFLIESTKEINEEQEKALYHSFLNKHKTKADLVKAQQVDVTTKQMYSVSCVTKRLLKPEFRFINVYPLLSKEMQSFIANAAVQFPKQELTREVNSYCYDQIMLKENSIEAMVLLFCRHKLQ